MKSVLFHHLESNNSSRLGLPKPIRSLYWKKAISSDTAAVSQERPPTANGSTNGSSALRTDQPPTGPTAAHGVTKKLGVAASLSSPVRCRQAPQGVASKAQSTSTHVNEGNAVPKGNYHPQSESPTRILIPNLKARNANAASARAGAPRNVRRSTHNAEVVAGNPVVPIGVLVENVEEFSTEEIGKQASEDEQEVEAVEQAGINVVQVVAETPEEGSGLDNTEAVLDVDGVDTERGLDEEEHEEEVSQDVTARGEEGLEEIQVDLREMLQRQERTLKNRNSELFHERADIFQSPRNRGNAAALLSIHSLQPTMGDHSNKPDTPEGLWKGLVDLAVACDTGFFSSHDARMKNSNRCVGKGSAAYSGLKVNRYNCIELNEIYTLRYRTKELMNMASGSSFKLLQSIVGQFLRWFISSKRLGRYDGWKERALFRQLAKEDLVQVFVNHFITTSSSSTVASKCNALHVVTKYATLKFNDDATRLRIARVALYLTTTFNAAKCKYREDARQKQDADRRVKEHRIVTESQIKKGIRLARAVLEDIIDSYFERAERKGPGSAERMLAKTSGLIQKWCLNVLGLLTLSGGGQRPQAYARLQCPPRKVLEAVYGDDELTQEVVNVKTFREETARALDIPDVTFPVIVLPYITFHVEVIRPILLNRPHVKPSAVFRKNEPLLLHTRTGEYMTPNNVSHSISAFMRGVDPKLTNVTAMTLRASYATCMLHSYRQGMFKDSKLSEDEFLGLVAKQMNTSVEQLRGTYMAAYSKDFTQTMKLFTKHFSIVMNEKGDDIEGCVEREESEDDDDKVEVGDSRLKRRRAEQRRRVPKGLFDYDGESDAEVPSPKRKVRRKTKEKLVVGSAGSSNSGFDGRDDAENVFPDEEEEEEEEAE